MKEEIVSTKINLGILVQSEEIFLWHYRVIENIFLHELASVKLFMIQKPNSSQARIAQYPIFYLFHEWIDKLVFGKSVDYDRKINFTELCKATSQVMLSKKSDAACFTISELSEIQTHCLDLILNFGEHNLNGELVKFSRLGVLNYLISNQVSQINGPTCYWEVIKMKAEIELSIQLRQADNLKNSEVYSTGILPYPNSIHINRNNAYDLASLLIPRVIQRISNQGNAFLNGCGEKSQKSGHQTSINESENTYPTSFLALLNFLLLFFVFFKRKILYHKIGRWFLYFKINDQNKVFPPDLSTLKIIKSPVSIDWADPFVVSKDAFHYVFVEEYLAKLQKGRISVLKLDSQGNFLDSQVVIDKPYHLSFPYVFAHNESFFMIPESGSNRTIDLYKCDEFPYKWVFVNKILNNIHAKDTSIFFFNNKWWLFTSIIEKNNSTLSFNELFLFYSDDLLSSEWKSHPKNPIVSDIKSSRPAGSIYMHDNKIYRPSQDCSGIYGRALNINCITKLSETDYEEVLVSRTEPDLNTKVKGIHTFNFNEKIIFMDAYFFKRRLF